MQGVAARQGPTYIPQGRDPVCYLGQKIFLVVRTILSLFIYTPHLQFGTSISLRSFSFLSSALLFVEHSEKNGLAEKILQVTQMVLILLGIGAVAFGKPLLMVIALTTDIAIRSIELIISAIRDFAPLAVSDLFIIATDLLTLGGIVFVSWELIALSLFVSSLFMLIQSMVMFLFAVEDKRPLDMIDSICFTILAIAYQRISDHLGPQIRFVPKSHHYNIRNPSHTLMHVVSETGEEVALVEPRQTIALDRSPKIDKGRLFLTYDQTVSPELPKFATPFVSGNEEFYRGPLELPDLITLSCHNGTAVVNDFPNL